MLKKQNKTCQCADLLMRLHLFPAQAVCVRLPPSAAEALEGVVQPCAAGPRVYGSDAGCCLSRHVSFFQFSFSSFARLPR